MQRRQNIILALLILQPVLDIITGLSVTTNNNISIGALLRTCMIALLFIWTLYYFATYKRSFLWLYCSAYSAILLMMVINLILKDPYFLLAEVNFGLKATYYLTMLFTIFVMIDKRMLNLRIIDSATYIISFIIGGTYWIAILTKTSFSSYTYASAGYSGWFFAANELSVIVIILIGLTLSILYRTQSLPSLLTFLLLLSTAPMIGTKTAFAGSMILLLAFILLSRQHIFKNKTITFILITTMAFIILLPFTPIGENLSLLQTTSNDQVKSTDQIKEDANGLPNQLLSSRDVYLAQTKEDFMEANIMRKAFGLAYAGNYLDQQKLIEMDFFDLFFSFGMIGSLFLLLPLGYIIRQSIAFLLHPSYLLLILTLGLSFSISFFAGHVLFAPSVMTYMAILLLAINKEIQAGDANE